jgi:4-hydroxybenzoate polyprenyltransferase
MKKLLAILQLLRLPNVFTAMADIFMGFLISHGSLEPWREFFPILLGSSSIYLAGMVLNDWFDFDIDRQERPERPLPSGRVSKASALVGGIVLLAVGVAAATVAGSTSRNVALVLVAAVLLYDGALKSTLFGPATMGLCRALNVLLGMSSQPDAIWLFDMSRVQMWRFGTMAAAGVGLYIMGVTRFARREATGAARAELISSAFGFNLGLLLIALITRVAAGNANLRVEPSDPYWFVMDAAPGAFPANGRIACAALLWGAVVIVTNGMVWRAVMSGQPRAIQQAIKTCILSLIALDAAVVALVVGPIWAAIVLALLGPTLILGRWVYST